MLLSQSVHTSYYSISFQEYFKIILNDLMKFSRLKVCHMKDSIIYGGLSFGVVNSTDMTRHDSQPISKDITININRFIFYANHFSMIIQHN